MGGRETKPLQQPTEKELFISKVITPNYTDAQVARINEQVALTGANAATAELLSTELGKSRRSVIAKMVRMDIGYAAKARTTKSGDPIEKKADLVAEIAAVVAGNLEGLDSAPKAALVALRDYLTAE